MQTSRRVDSHPSFKILASPTSAILAVQSRASSTLALFKSKCTILRRYDNRLIAAGDSNLYPCRCSMHASL